MRALLPNSKLLLLDEPFENLDEAAAKALLNYLKKLENTTVIIASNDSSLSKECNAVLQLQKQV